MPSDPTVISYPALPVDRLQSIKKALAEIFGKLTISEQEALRGHDAERIHCRVLEQTLRPRVMPVPLFVRFLVVTHVELRIDAECRQMCTSLIR